MEKKNTLLLTVIAVATLLVAVVGATFAYFASTIQNNALVNVSGSVESSEKIFTTSGDGTFTFSITADNMLKSAADDTKDIWNETKDIVVTYTAGGKETSCTYDLMFAWDSGIGINSYVKTEEALREFTYAVASTEKTGTAEATGLPSTSGSASVTETNFPNGTVATTNLGSYSISSSNNNVETQTHKITLKFYNADADQHDIGGKTYKGHFYVDNIDCAGQIQP